MAYHDDLLQQALDLIHKEPRRPKQASLRRAVSTAYYALFHLLISETVANWKRAGLRSELARAFDHGTMKSASIRIQQSNFTGQNGGIIADLKFVARTFGQLQEKRHIADYDNATFSMKNEALQQVLWTREAFMRWRRIRSEDIAQKYLLSLFVKKRG